MANQSLAYKLGRSMGKKKEAEMKVRQAIDKMRLASQIRVQEAGVKQQQSQAIKQNDPVQQYLRKRYAEENPIAAMDIPEEGEKNEKGEDKNEVEFPASEVKQDSGGKMTEKPISEKKQMMNFMTAYTKMKESGKKPSPLADKIFEKYKNKANNVPKEKQEKAPGEKKTNKATQDFLDMIADGIGDNSIKTKKQAQDLVTKHGPQLGVRGADVGHIYEQINRFLPDEEEAKPKKSDPLGTIKKMTGAFFEKVAGGWKRITASGEKDEEEKEPKEKSVEDWAKEDLEE